MSQPRWACPCSRRTNFSGSTLLSREPSEAGPRLRAPPRSKPLRFSAQVALRGADSVGTAFCALPRSGPSSSGVWRARSLRLVAFPVSAAQFPGCTCGTPCEADSDCPEPPEVLAKKPTCSLVGKVRGCNCPLPALSALAACSRQGGVCSWLFPFCPLFCARFWWCLMFELFAW